MVGMRTRRCPPSVAASPSSHLTPASPRLSVSAIRCACVTGTMSSAPKNSPTLIWCCSACCGTGPALPARISFSSSLSFISIDPDAGVTHGFAPFGQLALLKFCEGVTDDDAGDHTQRLQPASEHVAADDPLNFARQRRCDCLAHAGRRKDAPP